MNILVTGASGLIGSALSRALAGAGHRIVSLNRGSNNSVPRWNPESGEINLNGAGKLDAVIHLAGEPIAQRWTESKKARIRDSRVNGTRLLCEALARLPQTPRVLIAASATGFYGNRRDELLDEESPHGVGFLADVCREWEAAAAPAVSARIRTVHTRFGIVLSPRGGALAKMLPAFLLGLGGKLGDGQHYWSWIALPDLIHAVEHALDNEGLRGPVNVVSPNPVTNLEFTKTLGSVLNRPTFFAMPAFAVKLLFGQMGQEALLASFRVRPARLLANGFSFEFSQLKPALRHLLANG